MNVIEKKLSEIKPYEKNPRINDDAVQYVANSIQQFGFKVPIVIDKNGVIAAGHTRYKAAQQLGLETVPCVIADDLTQKQIAAFRIADNKTAEKSDWDRSLLGDELKSLIDDFDFTDFGFGDFELTMLQDDMEPEPYDEEVIEEYSDHEEEYLAKKRVIITYLPVQEELVKELLGVEEIKRVVYDISDLQDGVQDESDPTEGN